MPSIGIWRAHLGFAQEVTYGTTVATASVFIPAMSYDAYDDDQGIVLDEGMRAAPSRIYGAYTGMRQGKWSATMPFYPNQTGRFLAYFLATDTISTTGVTGTTAWWEHTMILNSSANPHTDTVFEFVGSTASERAFAGSAYESMDLKFSRGTGFMTAKLAAKAFAPSTATLAEQSPTYTGDPMLRGWQGVFAVAGTTRATLMDFELNAKREIELVFAANNSQSPADFQAGKLELKGKAKIYGSTEQPYTDYRALTQQAVTLTFQEATAGSTQNYLSIAMAKCIFTKVTPNLSGKFLTWDVDFEAIHNTSAGGDSGPATVVLRVATSSQYST